MAVQVGIAPACPIASLASSSLVLFVTIVLDGVGIGAQPDADRYGDVGADTLGHVCAAERPPLPNLAALGLGRIAPLTGVPPTEAPTASWGRMREVSAGKDSTTGHWELAGLRLSRPFPTYPHGFPAEVIDAFVDETGVPGVLSNQPASGTAVIDEHGPEHERTGRPIVYTSADSVFQIAAHVDVIPLDALYRLCRIARDVVCVGPHAVGRVIARPFTGTAGAYRRLSEKRQDYAVAPSAPTLQSALQAHGVRTVSVGKVADLFAGAGFDGSHKTASNEEGIAVTRRLLREADGTPTFVWVNLVDFDQEYGHRNDAPGFAAALAAFDAALPDLLDALPSGGRLLLTADHGNDPTTPGTDHTREFVPVLLAGGDVRDLGVRASFNDHAATVAAFFEAPFETDGTSFL